MAERIDVVVGAAVAGPPEIRAGQDSACQLGQGGVDPAVDLGDHDAPAIGALRPEAVHAPGVEPPLRRLSRAGHGDRRQGNRPGGDRRRGEHHGGPEGEHETRQATPHVRTPHHDGSHTIWPGDVA